MASTSCVPAGSTLPVGFPYARRVAAAYLAIAAQAQGEGEAARRLLEAEPADLGA